MVVRGLHVDWSLYVWMYVYVFIVELWLNYCWIRGGGWISTPEMTCVYSEPLLVETDTRINL